MRIILRNLKAAGGFVRPVVWPAMRAGKTLLEVFDTPRARWLAASRGVASLILGLALYAFLPSQNFPADNPAENTSVLAPDYLSNRDRELYQRLFSLGPQADGTTVHELLASIDNKILAGHVLSTLYLGGNYTASKDELVAWLAQYSDHTEAGAIRALALTRGVAVASLSRIAPEPEELRGDGYIDHMGRTPMPDSWYQALNAWKENNYATAAKLFSAIGANESLSRWQRSAGYYWAARADGELGNRWMAYTSLKKAASFDTTFYGLLAARKRGEELRIRAVAPEVPSTIASDAHAVRARAAAVVGELALAETELRQLYTTLEKSERAALLTLASQLNLANLQVRLGNLQGLSQEEKTFAAYPLPRWLIEAQAEVDPALLLAIARQESVFREDATSQAGAVGMMQMLPSTARMMMSGLKDEGIALASTTSDALPMAEQLTNPQLNIRLGAAYVRHLMEQQAVGNNLVKVLAAYNAGPGSVSAWQRTAAKVTDPLLYIESIPFSETRNYVMQVMAHYWVYQSLMGEPSPALDALAAGDWPGVA